MAFPWIRQRDCNLDAQPLKLPFDNGHMFGDACGFSQKLTGAYRFAARVGYALCVTLEDLALWQAGVKIRRRDDP
jgi:hypothetical protein